MKTLLLFLIVTFAFTGSAIAKKGDDLSLRVGEQKTAKTSKLKIKFLSVVEDSRCPKDVNCIWAGNAKIKVLLTTGRTSKEVEMNTALGVQGNQIEGWAVNLVSLSENPKDMPATGCYTANFTITKLTR